MGQLSPKVILPSLPMLIQMDSCELFNVWYNYNKTLLNRTYDPNPYDR
jgi:hypothetical protein